MPQIENFQGNIADWRRQLKINESRTKVVIFLFIALYLMVGLIVDIVVAIELHHLSLSQAISQLSSLHIFPLATVIMLIIAAVSLFITYALHDKIILFGTEYHEVTAQNATTLEEKQLYNVVEEMKVASGLRYMPKVYLINADYMNAFASGYSEKSALVAITKGLIQKLDRAELQAVMAHELSHIRHHDIKLTLTASLLSNIMIIVIDILFRTIIYSSMGNRSSSSRNGRNGAAAIIIVIMILRFVLPIITVLLMLYLSRTREYMADAGAVELMRDNEPMAKALLKISDDYSANRTEYAAEYKNIINEGARKAAYIFDPASVGLQPVTSIASFFSTHPSIKDRLKALGFTLKRK